MSAQREERYQDVAPAERARLLLAEIQRMQAQLGNRDCTDGDGRRMEGHEYWQWRHRAQYALQFRLEDYRAAKAEARASVIGADRAADGGMSARAAVALKRAFEEMFEEVDVRLEPLSDTTLSVRIITGDFPDVVIYGGAVREQTGGAQ